MIVMYFLFAFFVYFMKFVFILFDLMYNFFNEVNEEVMVSGFVGEDVMRSCSFINLNLVSNIYKYIIISLYIR